jgi:hypothetical protein
MLTRFSVIRKKLKQLGINERNFLLFLSVIFSPVDGGTVCVPPKRRYLPTSSHRVTAQETNINVFTAVRTSDLMLCD